MLRFVMAFSQESLWRRAPSPPGSAESPSADDIPVLEPPEAGSSPEHSEEELAYRLQQYRAWEPVLQVLKPRLQPKKHISADQETAALDLLLTLTQLQPSTSNPHRIDPQCSYTVQSRPATPQFHYGYCRAFFLAMQFKLPHLVYYLCTAFTDARVYLERHIIGDLEACAALATPADRAIFKTLLKALPVDKLRHLDFNQLLNSVSQVGKEESLHWLLQDTRIPWGDIVKDEAPEYRPFQGSRMTMDQLTRVELVQNVLEHCPGYLKTLFKNRALFPDAGSLHPVLEEFELEGPKTPWAKFGKPYVLKAIRKLRQRTEPQQPCKRQRVSPVVDLT